MAFKELCTQTFIFTSFTCWISVFIKSDARIIFFFITFLFLKHASLQIEGKKEGHFCNYIFLNPWKSQV